MLYNGNSSPYSFGTFVKYTFWGKLDLHCSYYNNILATTVIQKRTKLNTIIYCFVIVQTTVTLITLKLTF